MSLSLLPHPWPDLLRGMRQPYLQNQEPLASHPEVQEVNRRLVREGLSNNDEGRPVALLWNQAAGYRCFQLFQWNYRTQKPEALGVPDYCDPIKCRAQGLGQPRPPTFEEIKAKNHFIGTEQEQKDYFDPDRFIEEFNAREAHDHGPDGAKFAAAMEAAEDSIVAGEKAGLFSSKGVFSGRKSGWTPESDLGDFLKESGIKPADLAEKMGVSKTTISNWASRGVPEARQEALIQATADNEEAPSDEPDPQ